MKKILTAGATSQTIQVFIPDSTSTTGAGLAGLVFNSSGLTAYFLRDGDATPTVITLVTATVGTWTTSGFKEIDATNMTGWYEIGVPNAVIAAGVTSAALHIQGATNMAMLPIEVQLTAFDLNTASTAQTGDGYAVVAHASYGNDKLVRATTPANTLDISAGGEAGVDWANIGNPTTSQVLSGTTVGTTTTITDKAGYALSTAGVDAILDEAVEGSETMRQLLRLIRAVLLGKSSGGGTSTLPFRDLADSKPRVTATVDSNGNRTAITTDAT